MTVRLTDYLNLYILEALVSATRPSANTRAHSMVYDEAGRFSQGAQHVRPEREEIRARAQLLLDDLADNLSRAVRDYLFMACSGEARHAHNKSGTQKIAEIPYSAGRDAVYSRTHEFNPRTGFPILAQCFSKGWGSGYGGVKWQNIALAGQMYYDPTITPVIFLDHCADLKHNGGLCYDKKSSEKYTNFLLNETYMLHILDWKMKHNVLTEPPNDTKTSANWYIIDYEVHRLMMRYVTVWLRATPPGWMAWANVENRDWSYIGLTYGDRVYTFGDPEAAVQPPQPLSNYTNYLANLKGKQHDE